MGRHPRADDPGRARRLARGGEGHEDAEHRTVRLLAPLREDLLAWRMRSGPPIDGTPVFPGPEGRQWSKTTYDNWCSANFDRRLSELAIEGTTPYALRHSFASLLLHEGRSVIYVARQLGHDARLTLSTYGHVIDELDEATADRRRGRDPCRRDTGVPLVCRSAGRGNERAQP